MSLRTWLIKFSTTNEVWDDHCSNLTGMLKFQETKIPGCYNWQAAVVGAESRFFVFRICKKPLMEI